MIRIIIRNDQFGTEVDVKRVSGRLFWKKEERLQRHGIPPGREEALRFAYAMAIHTASEAVKRGEGPAIITFEDGLMASRFVKGASLDKPHTLPRG